MTAIKSNRSARARSTSLPDPVHEPPRVEAYQVDPIFPAIRALDRASQRWSTAFVAWLDLMEALDPQGRYHWDDPAAVARVVLGPLAGSTIQALTAAEERLRALTPARYAAEDRFIDTAPTSEIGVAAYRAAVRRFVHRADNVPSDGAVMLKRMKTALAA